MKIFKNKAISKSLYIELCNPFSRISNSFHGLVILSLELDNLFSRIAIRSLELDNQLSRIEIRSIRSLVLYRVNRGNDELQSERTNCLLRGKELVSGKLHQVALHLILQKVIFILFLNTLRLNLRYLLNLCVFKAKVKIIEIDCETRI